jgi:hypothetical protein
MASRSVTETILPPGAAAPPPPPPPPSPVQITSGSTPPQPLQGDSSVFDVSRAGAPAPNEILSQQLVRRLWQVHRTASGISEV